MITNEEYEKIVDNYLALLSEHFDAVQIMVTWQDGGFTKGIKRGAGNWYARKGICAEWLDEDHARTSNIIKIEEFSEGQEQ